MDEIEDFSVALKGKVDNLERQMDALNGERDELIEQNERQREQIEDMRRMQMEESKLHKQSNTSSFIQRVTHRIFSEKRHVTSIVAEAGSFAS